MCAIHILEDLAGPVFTLLSCAICALSIVSIAFYAVSYHNKNISDEEKIWKKGRLVVGYTSDLSGVEYDYDVDGTRYPGHILPASISDNYREAGWGTSGTEIPVLYLPAKPAKSLPVTDFILEDAQHS